MSEFPSLPFAIISPNKTLIFEGINEDGHYIANKKIFSFIMPCAWILKKQHSNESLGTI